MDLERCRSIELEALRYITCCFERVVVVRSTYAFFSTELDRTNIIYTYKYPLGNHVSNENDTYVGLNTTTLSRRLSMHLYIYIYIYI